MKNPYKVLGVPDNAPIAECRRGYRRMCAKYHPDSPSGNRVRFDEVQEAWKMVEEGGYILEAAVAVSGQSGLTHASLFRFKAV